MSASKAAREKQPLPASPGAASQRESPEPSPITSRNGHGPARVVAHGHGDDGDQREFIECWTDAEEAAATGLFQILDEEGRADPKRVPPLSHEELRRIYTGMLTSRLLDQRVLPLQRQGRIGFYIGATGQEAGVIAGAHALTPEDWFVPGLRETSAGLYRGMPLRTHLAQMFGNANDLTRGRQMPCHSGTRASHHVVMSSCVSSQLPHATGLAMAARLRGEKAVALGYCGDGGTSEEDFHVGLNFAAVFKAPVVFVCQNNQWAISTPLALQTVSATIALKGLAYGIPSLRVDGNDVFAMYVAISQAVARARAGGGPTFIEALTYRLGAHSSSDDPTRYRDDAEPEEWRKKDPLVRFRKWLYAAGLYTPESDAALSAAIEAEIREAISLEEAAAPPPLASLVEDVFAETPAHLREQLAELERVRNKARG